MTRRQSLPDMRRATSGDEQVTMWSAAEQAGPGPLPHLSALKSVAAGSGRLGLGGVLDPLALGVSLRISALNCI